jgi:3-deoxy-D-manno-octulosonate 8-phosphate phosphatase (KDO 8-P phosphatase)
VDLGPLQRAGVAVAVANAVREAKAAAHLVTRTAGGHGAVREVVELILKAQKKWNPFVAHYTE